MFEKPFIVAVTLCTAQFQSCMQRWRHHAGATGYTVRPHQSDITSALSLYDLPPGRAVAQATHIYSCCSIEAAPQCRCLPYSLALLSAITQHMTHAVDEHHLQHWEPPTTSTDASAGPHHHSHHRMCACEPGCDCAPAASLLALTRNQASPHWQSATNSSQQAKQQYVP